MHATPSKLKCVQREVVCVRGPPSHPKFQISDESGSGEVTGALPDLPLCVSSSEPAPGAWRSLRCGRGPSTAVGGRGDCVCW